MMCPQHKLLSIQILVVVFYWFYSCYSANVVVWFPLIEKIVKLYLRRVQGCFRLVLQGVGLWKSWEKMLSREYTWVWAQAELCRAILSHCYRQQSKPRKTGSARRSTQSICWSIKVILYRATARLCSVCRTRIHARCNI